MLGVVRAPDVAGPGKVLMAGTPPAASLVAELQDGESQGSEDEERWREPGTSRLVRRFGQLILGAFILTGALAR